MGEASRNLLIVHTPGCQGIDDWLAVRAKIEARAPDIEVRIAENGRPNSVTRRWQVRRPSLVFSPVPLVAYRPLGGKVYAGRSNRELPKWKELERLRACGLPVPETVRLTPELRLTEPQWHPYVVVKPERGMRGKHIRLVRSADLGRRYAELTMGGRKAMLVQPFVDHVDAEGRPQARRVLTLFGREIYAARVTWAEPRRPLTDLADDPDGIVAVNDLTPARSRELIQEVDVIALARKAGAALSEVPALGIDIVRENGTGRLFIMETNPSGYVWHLSSQLSQENHSTEFRESLYRQFDALGRTAELLIAKTRMEAV